MVPAERCSLFGVVAFSRKSRYFVDMLTPEQCRAARAWLDITQPELASLARVSPSTVRDFEAGRRTPIPNNLAAIQLALEERGMFFSESAITFRQP